MLDTHLTPTHRWNDLGKTSNCRAFSLIFIVILVVYGNSLYCDWHYDDLHNIVENPAIRMKTLDRESILQAFTDGDQRSGRITRPLAYLSFAVNFLFGELEVFGYHAVNLSIHLLAAMILFLLIRDIMYLPSLKSRYGPQADQIALLSTSFWALHPLNTTAITYIVQRMASMAALFYLLALYCYAKGRMAPDKKRMIALFIACLAAGIAGLLTKENAALLPISILALEFCLIQPTGAKLPAWLKRASVAFVAVFTFYCFFKLSSTGFLKGYEIRPFTLIQRLLTQPRILIFYLGLFIYPTGSRLMLLHDPVVSISLVSPWTTLPSLLLVLGGIGFSVVKRKRFPLVCFPLLFFFLNHAIESSIIPLELVYEHRNYLPTALLGIPIAAGFLHLMEYFQRSRLVTSLLILTGAFIIGGNGLSTYLYNDTLKTDLRLWMDNARKAPNLSVVHNNLGNVWLAHGETEQAVKSFEKALLSDRFNNIRQKAVVNYNLGRAYERQFGKGHEKAQNAYISALSISPNYPKALLGLAQCYQQAGELSASEKLIQRAIKTSLQPNNPILLNGLSLVQLKQGKLTSAYRLATRSLLALPDQTVPKTIQAEVHHRRQQNDQAIRCWESLLQQHPDNLDALLALCELYHRAKAMDKALTVLRRISGLLPSGGVEALIATQKEKLNFSAWTNDWGMVKAAFRRYHESELEGINRLSAR